MTLTWTVAAARGRGPQNVAAYAALYGAHDLEFDLGSDFPDGIPSADGPWRYQESAGFHDVLGHWVTFVWGEDDRYLRPALPVPPIMAFLEGASETFVEITGEEITGLDVNLPAGISTLDLVHSLVKQGRPPSTSAIGDAAPLALVRVGLRERPERAHAAAIAITGALFVRLSDVFGPDLPGVEHRVILPAPPFLDTVISMSPQLAEIQVDVRIPRPEPQHLRWLLIAGLIAQAGYGSYPPEGHVDLIDATAVDSGAG